MQLSLAFCQAPRVAFNEKGAEEPYGWESREYLRKMLIGQVVKFKVLYKVDAISRSFASLEFKGKDVLRDVVEKGMVSVRTERDDKGQKELYETLLHLQSDARSAHRGIWGDKRKLRSVNWTLSDPESFFKVNKGLPLVGVVEQVRDGSTFRLYLPETSDMIMLHLAGVQSPRITYAADGTGATSVCISRVASYEPLSQECRQFSELRLLNRSVVFLIDGMDKFNVRPSLRPLTAQNFFGRIHHPRGNIAVELLRAGLAKLQDWSANFLPAGIADLRAAELAAKTDRLRLWKDWVWFSRGSE